MSDGMSLQTCHCGWSKVTTYHGLRTHQGIKGCTPGTLELPVSTELTVEKVSDGMSLQTCHCGWSKVTTYHGLRTHQGIKGCTPKSTKIPDRTQQIIFNTYIPKFTYAPGPPPDDFMIRQILDVAKGTESFQKDVSFPSFSSLLEASPSNQLFQTETLQMSRPPAANMTQNQPMLFGSQPKAAIGATVKKPLFGSAQQPLQLSENGSKTRNALDSMIGQQQTSRSQTVTVADVVMDGKENKPVFGPVSASTFHFAPNRPQNTFNQNKQTESFNVITATSGVSSLDSGFGGTVPPFSVFSNNNQTQGAFCWPPGGQQLSSPMSGSFNAQTPAAHNVPQMDKTGPSLSGNQLISDAPMQVTNSGPSLSTTEASVNKEIRPGFGGTVPPFSVFSNNNQTQGAFCWPPGGQQLSSPMSGSFNAQTPAAHNVPQMDKTGPSLLGNQLISDAPIQVTNSGPSLSTTEASVNKEIRPASGASQNTFGPNKHQLSSPMSGSFNAQTPAAHNVPQMDKTGPSLSGNQLISDAPVQVTNSGPSLSTTEASVNKEIRPASGASQNTFGPNKPQPKSRNAFTAASGDSSVRQNIPQLQQKSGFPQAQPPSPSAATQGAMSQTPSSSQQGPETFGAAVKENQNTVTSSTANTTGAPQKGQRESQSGPATPKTPPQHEPQSYFETPKQNSDQQSAAEANRTRRALDFSTGAVQAQTSLAVPTTTTQTIAPPVGDQKEAEKLQQLLRDKIKAELQQKIRCRDQKLCEIGACVKACEGSLDKQWLEIDIVFSNAIHLVEEARQRALQPIENRREKLKRDSKVLIQKIQEDIVKLENDIKEVDTAADLDAVPLSKLKDFKKINVDTDFAFGTLQTTISTMMEQIQEEMDKLSALELKRAPAFAVDVKLDHSSAHQWLAVSKDGKKVQDGGQCQSQLPVSRGQFELYGSIVGASPFGWGRAYWEVQVGAKTGWDLGVASAKANRKGKLTLGPDGGYWVLVHFQGDKYAALTAPPVRVDLKHKPQKVGVFLDYEEGLVSFYDVTNQTHIYSFTNCGFHDGILPYFSPHLKQNGKNAEPLVITEVKN